MVNVQFGCICKLGIIIRADPIARLSHTSGVDYDTLTITLQYVFAVIILVYQFLTLLLILRYY
jgi:hypothetical protein